MKKIVHFIAVLASGICYCEAQKSPSLEDLGCAEVGGSIADG